MARKLKTYQTSLGFYDLAIAAPSMKAALEAWGAGSNLFHQGIARETDDPDIVAAAMTKPGVVLRRPVGSHGPFQEHSDLPKDLAGDEPRHRASKTGATERAPPKNDDQAARKAVIAFEKERRRRESQRRKEEAARKKQQERRDQAIAKAQAALAKAERKHDNIVATIGAERDALEHKSQAENARWAKEKDRLERALRLARE